MDEYIKREDALDAVLFALVGTGYQSRAIDAIRDIPTADVAPRAEWISVEERLPESLTYVIVHDEDGTIGEAFHSYDGCFEWAANEKIAFVTHWMPLPEPPKGV